MSQLFCPMVRCYANWVTANISLGAPRGPDQCQMHAVVCIPGGEVRFLPALPPCRFIFSWCGPCSFHFFAFALCVARMQIPPTELRAIDLVVGAP
jgi:hypothetical protein